MEFHLCFMTEYALSKLTSQKTKKHNVKMEVCTTQHTLFDMRSKE